MPSNGIPQAALAILRFEHTKSSTNASVGQVVEASAANECTLGGILYLGFLPNAALNSLIGINLKISSSDFILKIIQRNFYRNWE
jgi:hypothetical protein